MLPEKHTPLILIVDDEPQARAMMSQIIQHRGYHTAVARSGEEALEYIEHLEPDLVVLDAMLPGIDGFEVCTRIKAQTTGNNTPVLMVTGLRDDQVIQRAFGAGAADYIAKPFQSLELQQRMEQLLRTNQAEKNLRETRERYEALFNRSLDAVYIHDFDGNFIDANGAALQMLGYSHDEILKMNFLTLLPRQQTQQAVHIFETIKAKGFHEDVIEFELKHKSGTFINVQTRTSLIYHHGHPWAIQGIARNTTIRKSMERALRNSEARYRSIIESNADGIVIVDQEGVVHFINPAAEALFGRQADELVGHQFGFPLVIGETAEVEVILPARHQPPNMRIAEMRVVETEWEGQVAYLASLRDISERKQAEEALRENEEQMRLIFEHAPIGMFTTNLEGQFLNVNPAFCQTVGYTSDELLSMNYAEITHPDDVHATHDANRSVLDGHTSYYQIEKRYIRRDRRVVYASLHRSLVRGSEGVALHFIGQSVDITERKHVENVLRQSEERFRLLAENTRDLIALHEPDGTYTYISPSSETLLGYKADELVGLHPHQFIHPDDLKQTLPPSTDIASIGHIISKATYRIRKRSGTYGWFETQAQSIIDETGNFVGLVTSSRDITERKQAEEKLRESERFARSTVDALSAHIAILDKTGTIIAANQAWHQHTSNRVEIGANYLHVCDQSIGQKNNAFSDGIHTVIKGQMQEFTLEYQNNGHWFTARVTRFAGEGPVRVVVSHEDITQLKQVERAEHQQRELAEALLDTAATLSSTLELDEVLKRILVNIERVLPHDMANIMFIEDGVAQIVGSQGYSPGVESRLRLVRVRVQENPTLRHMFTTGQPLIIYDTETASQWSSFVPVNRLRSYAGVPITHGNEVIGFLNLDSTIPGFFSSIDTQRLEVFASQAAIAINNARAYDKAQELAMLEERQRLARDLHDAVTQTVFSASLISESLPRLWDINPDRVRDSLPKMHRLIRGALAEMRSMLLELRPNALLETALPQLLIQLGEALMGRTGMKCDVIIEGQFSLQPQQKIALYRIAQEALNNIFKHSRGTEVFIRLSHNTRHIILQITDNGRGFDPKAVSPGRLGLDIMKERAAEIGAALTIISKPSGGTEITVRIEK